MDFLRRLYQQVQQIYLQMSMARRVAIGAVIVAIAVLVGAVIYYASQTDYRVLYANLSEEDAGAISSRLQTQAVPYRLEDGGKTIKVPADRVAQVRVTLAADGLPTQGGKGFELFDQTSLGMTPFTQHVNYQRALQGELARTIMQVEPVVAARVHIVRPEPSPFIREQKPTTASVVVKLKSGATLSRSTAAGIVALVARAVEGLTPENVTILDASGKVLSEPPQPEAGAVTSQLEYRRTLENYLTSKAEDMLTQLLGPGRAIVRVAADVNFQRLRERKETYNPQGRVVLSETVTNNKTTNQGGPRGVAGTGSNVPTRLTGAGATGTTGGGTTSTSTEETIDTKYAVSKTTQELEDRLGNLDRLTIAVMVDLTPAEGTQGRLPTEADVTEIIKQAVGFKQDRDQIKVSNVKLAGPLVSAPEVDVEIIKIQQWQNYVNIIRNASLGVAALVALILGFMLLRRLRPAPPVPLPPPPPPPPPPEVQRRLDAVTERTPEEIAEALSAWI